MERKTVFEFIEETKDLPQKMTVESSTAAQYLFHLLIRFYQRKTGIQPTFCHYSKQQEGSIKSVVEEHSVMNADRLYVMSDCDAEFVANLKLPKGTYLVAEATKGELKTERYRYYMKRDVLRAILTVLGMKLRLGLLLPGDWSGMKDYGDYETVLRKAKVAEWTEEEVITSLEAQPRVLILSGIKKGDFAGIYQLAELRGETYVYNAIQESLVTVLRYKFYEAMGHDDNRILKELDLSPFRMREVVQEAAALKTEDCETLAKELVARDMLFARNKTLGLGLVLLSSRIRTHTR